LSLASWITRSIECACAAASLQRELDLAQDDPVRWTSPDGGASLAGGGNAKS
jgi:hypothetical protein